MGGTDGTRAVSEVMGAILVFGILITALGVYQAVVVPNANEEVEFKHNAEVQQDFVDLRNDIQRSSTIGDDGSVTVDLGVRYPTRALTLNPPEQGGTLQGKTTGPTDSDPPDLAVENAEAVDTEVADYWNGDPQEFATGRVVFTPSYSVYQHAPNTVVENGIVYNKFENDDPDIPLSGQQVVSGTKISLVALDSDLSLSQVETTAVDVNPNSASTTRVAVRNQGDDENVTVTIPTKLSQEVWVGQLLNGQIDGANADTRLCEDIEDVADDTHTDRYIKDCHYTPESEFNNLTLVMEQDTTYTLNLAKVSVGKSGSSPGAHYVVPVESDEVSVPEGGQQRLVLEVRDEFDNPVSGATVNVSIDPGETTVEDSETLLYEGRQQDSFTNLQTNEDGLLEVTYRANFSSLGSPNDVAVQASFESDAETTDWDSDTRQNATFDLRVINASKIDRTQPLFNPEKGLIVRAANYTNEGCDSNNANCKLNIVLENTADESRVVTKGRYVFFTGDSQGDAPGDDSGLAYHDPSDTELLFGGETQPFEPNAIEFASGEQRTIPLKIYEGDEINAGSELDITDGQYFVFSFIINGERRETYFVAPSAGDGAQGA